MLRRGREQRLGCSGIIRVPSPKNGLRLNGCGQTLWPGQPVYCAVEMVADHVLLWTQ